ncbi:unnamed protein product, partial [marine sediment metagenome]
MIKYQDIPSISDEYGEARRDLCDAGEEVRTLLPCDNPQGAGGITQTGQGADRNLQGEMMATCECGCGQAVVLKPYCKGGRIYNPRFVWGHNKSTLEKHLSAETRKKMGEALKGRPSPRKGVHLSAETKRKLSEANKGYRHSEEAKRKISEAGKRRLCSKETREKISNANRGKSPWITGKRHSEKTKRKISESNRGKLGPNKGKQLSTETRRKLSKINRGKHHSEETKRKLSELNKGKHHSLEVRKKMSEAQNNFVREYPDK